MFVLPLLLSFQIKTLQTMVETMNCHLTTFSVARDYMLNEHITLLFPYGLPANFLIKSFT